MLRPQVRRRLRLPPEARDRTRGHGRVGASEHLRADQLDGRRPRQHSMRGLVDLAHAAAPQQFAELIASHFPRLRHLPAERRDDVRDDDGDADEQVVGVVHQQCVARRTEIPVALGTSPEHPHRIHGGREQAGEKGLRPGARHDGREHQDDCADPRDLWRHGQRREDRSRMKRQPQRKRGEDHVRQADIEDALRVPVGGPRIGKEQERREHAHGGDRIAHRQAEPDRLVALHRPHREPAQDGSGDPQAGGDERHDAETGGGFPKEIVREGSRPTACRSGLRRGRVSRRSYEFRDLHHSAGQCTVISTHEPARQGSTRATPSDGIAHASRVARRDQLGVPDGKASRERL